MMAYLFGLDMGTVALLLAAGIFVALAISIYVCAPRTGRGI